MKKKQEKLKIGGRNGENQNKMDIKGKKNEESKKKKL